MAPNVMYGLWQFLLNKNYIVYRIAYMLISFDIQVSITSPSVVALHFLVSEIVHCIACLLLFYKNYIVYCYYCGVSIEKYVCTKFRLNWLLCE